MAQVDSRLTTGLPGFDEMIKGLIPGDNIVWQVDDVEEYRPFIEPYCKAAVRLGQPLIYFRFASHPPLVEPGDGIQIYQLDPKEGFEAFLAGIHSVIDKTGHGGYYLFDLMSGLAEDWYSDQMLGNFFMLTCPYLYDVEAIAYFALLRNAHSQLATAAIADTTQILLDVYRYKESIYVHPWKVQARHSPTINMLHRWEGENFRPLTDSATIAEICTSVPWAPMGSASPQAGLWNRTFMDAEELVESDRVDPQGDPEVNRIFHRLLRMEISRDERVLELAERYMDLKDLVNIDKRIIGTGLIGGKSVGMLLARAILSRTDPQLAGLLEPHDSFFVGSDVFYTFLVRNGIWWVREKQRNPDTFLEGAERARQRMLMGTFPDSVNKRFEDMLDYFGQSPIIVRSSSLLEDNFGNAFAGKYESVFCPNQGSRDKRLDDFMSAVRSVYASAMSEKALTYRAQRGLLVHDEQMALLIQRVSGAAYGRLYFPQIAGVGFSFNPFAWNKQIDRQAGMMRLVFGLGTRAVDRSDDDYTRLVALNAPHLRPEANVDEVRQYSQRRVDLLDLEANQLVSRNFRNLLADSGDLPMDLLTSPNDAPPAQGFVDRAAPQRILTFEGLFEETHFVEDIRNMLRLLQEAYDYPVDIEFTANFSSDRSYKINIVQCRPLQVREGGKILPPPATIAPENLLLEAHGPVIGESRRGPVDRIVYVEPSQYAKLTIRDRYAVARLIGRLNQLERHAKNRNIMLLGPGRWGTTTPSLGVPVRFSDIDTASILGEIVVMRDDLVPDVSLGTHFFSDLVEQGMMYFALFPTREGNVLNHELLIGNHNRLQDLLGDQKNLNTVVWVLDTSPGLAGKRAMLNADSLQQRVVCYLDAGQGERDETT